MNIKLSLFADLRDYLPPGSDRYSCQLETDDGARVEDVLNLLNISNSMPKIILINGINGNQGETLKDGDVISVFPPIAGG